MNYSEMFQIKTKTILRLQREDLYLNPPNVFRRCYGNFFTCHDQQPFRTDSLEMEEVVLRDMTDYYGYVAWGEYSHCFAAVLNQVRHDAQSFEL